MSWWCSPIGCGRRSTPSGASRSARPSCSGWGRPGARATRRTGSCNGRRPPPGMRTRRSARRSRKSHARRFWTWTRCSTRPGSSRTSVHSSTVWRSSRWRRPVAELAAQGKVRDLYDVGDDRLLLVATDRISAFDVVLPDPIPDKGRVLTGLSLFWFERTSDLVPNHVVGASLAEFPAPFSDDPDLAGRATLVRRARVIPMECVVRGYLSGSGWAQPSFDKQYVRDWLDASGWDHEPPPPGLPTDVIARTSATYAEAYERLTGEPFADYLRRAGVGAA